MTYRLVAEFSEMTLNYVALKDTCFPLAMRPDSAPRVRGQ